MFDDGWAGEGQGTNEDEQEEEGEEDESSEEEDEDEDEQGAAPHEGANRNSDPRDEPIEDGANGESASTRHEAEKEVHPKAENGEANIAADDKAVEPLAEEAPAVEATPETKDQDGIEGKEPESPAPEQLTELSKPPSSSIGDDVTAPKTGDEETDRHEEPKSAD